VRPTAPEVSAFSQSSRSALLITGTVGAGKTSVAEVVGDWLNEAQIPNAVIDLDWLRRTWPSPPGDRFNMAMTLRNLRSVAANFLDSGSERLVLAGVVETTAQRERFREALDVPMAVCRLLVDLPVVHARLASRHENAQTALAWHLNRAGELDAILDAARVEDFCINAGTASLPEVAAEVIRAAGWADTALSALLSQ
jgi:adenylylsulfate kinase